MQKLELAKRIAEKCGISQAKSKEVIDCLMSEITSAVTNGESVTIQGFGSFRRAEVAEKTVNCFKQKGVTVPRHYAMRFKAGSPVKASLAGKAHAEQMKKKK